MAMGRSHAKHRLPAVAPVRGRSTEDRVLLEESELEPGGLLRVQVDGDVRGVRPIVFAGTTYLPTDLGRWLRIDAFEKETEVSDVIAQSRMAQVIARDLPDYVADYESRTAAATLDEGALVMRSVIRSRDGEEILRTMAFSDGERATAVVATPHTAFSAQVDRTGCTGCAVNVTCLHQDVTTGASGPAGALSTVFDRRWSQSGHTTDRRAHPRSGPPGSVRVTVAPGWIFDLALGPVPMGPSDRYELVAAPVLPFTTAQGPAPVHIAYVSPADVETGWECMVPRHQECRCAVLAGAVHLAIEHEDHAP